MRPQSTRWNRNYTKISEYYYKWEIDVMQEPEHIYDIDLMMKPIPIGKLEIKIPIQNLGWK